MSDEDDYMSASFLDVKEDIRPGLMHSKSTKRKLEIEKKRVISNEAHKTKSRRQLEEESRNIGMDSAISSDNKGFAMLQKMGYKPGMKLGAQKPNSSERGLIEPIRVTVKMNRGGLGSEEVVRNKIERIKEKRQKIRIYKERETELLTEDFRRRMKEVRTNKRLLNDLHKCQKTCEQLDKSNDVEEPSRPWFWFTQEADEYNEDDEEYEGNEVEDDLSIEEQIEVISDYLRSSYFYCYWCCINYNDADDLHQNCPGPDKSSHDDFDLD